MEAPHFCTYFDHRYLTRGLALWRSLSRHCPGAVLWVVCLDEECHGTLSHLAIAGIRLLKQSDLETAFPRLLAAKSSRSTVEYYFTCTPFLPLLLFRQNPNLARVTYLDADFFFYSSPLAVLEDTAEDSVVITPHGFPESHRDHEKFGIFNVGWVGFRNDSHGIKCLEWWGERCLEWCYDQVEPERFGDQKYLDQFPTLFDGVRILNHQGVNAAIWNSSQHFACDRDGVVHLGHEPLVCFHFHGFKMRNPWLLQTNAGYWKLPLSVDFKRFIITPYLAALDAEETLLKDRGLAKSALGMTTARGLGANGPRFSPRRTLETLRLWLQGNLSIRCCDRIY